jgi:hypothetical protein
MESRKQHNEKLQHNQRGFGEMVHDGKRQEKTPCASCILYRGWS